MLEGLRKAQQNWLGKIIITFLFGILIIAFSMVFIPRDMLSSQSTTVITAGKTTVSVDALKTDYQRFLKQVEMQSQRPVTAAEAKAMQLDRSVLSSSVSRAVLDENARKLGLSISDDAIRESIFAIPAFKTALGFDRNALTSYLNSMQMSEPAFFALQRSDIVRTQLLTPMTTGVTAPKAMQEFATRLVNERRDVTYYTVTDAAAGTIPEPTEAQIEATYQDFKAQFRAPEYRAFEALAVLPDALGKPDSISDDEARKNFEGFKQSGTFGPERRTYQQILFSSDQQAKDALARLKANKATFDALALEQKIAPEALTFGPSSKADILDPKIAETVFTLAKNQTSELIASPFGPVLLRVSEIQTIPFEDVKAQIKARLARERVQPQINTLRDSIEDMTANARPFSEIANELKIPFIEVKAIDKSGLDMNGQKVPGLPEAEQLIRATFASDIGVPNAALNMRDGGGIWYVITNVTPSRDRTLSEVRTQVVDIWKRIETTNRLAKIATDQLAQIKTPADLATVAAQSKAQVATARQLTRAGTPPAGIPAAALERVFSTPVGTPSSLNGGTSQVIFIVTAATLPANGSTAPETAKLTDQMAQGVSQDIVLEYITRSQKDLGVVVDQNMARNAFGTETEY